jgi:hypothetical protein
LAIDNTHCLTSGGRRRELLQAVTKFGESDAFAGLVSFFDIVVLRKGCSGGGLGCLDISDGEYGYFFLVMFGALRRWA